jgi:hypothetical protein
MVGIIKDMAGATHRKVLHLNKTLKDITPQILNKVCDVL